MRKPDRVVQNNSSCRALPSDDALAYSGSLFRLPSSPFGLIAVVGVVFLIVSMATRCVLLLESAAEVDMGAAALARTFAPGSFTTR